MSEERPSIGEKVKFWEEQDQINKALIPRFFEMHEVVKKLKARESDLHEKNITLEKKFESLTKELKNVKSEVNSLKSSNKNSKTPLIYSLVFISIIFSLSSLIISLA